MEQTSEPRACDSFLRYVWERVKEDLRKDGRGAEVEDIFLAASAAAYAAANGPARNGQTTRH